MTTLTYRGEHTVYLWGSPVVLNITAYYQTFSVSIISDYEPPDQGIDLLSIETVINDQRIVMESWPDDLADEICKAIYNDREMTEDE